jgi:hypothetical protein
MTKEERKEFDELICGSSCFVRPCYSQRGAADYLVYSDGIFRCNTRSHCARITPHRGKVALWLSRYNKVDSFKIALINRKIKSLKNALKVPPMKLVTQKGATWVELTDGKKVSPRHFSSQWWKFEFTREIRD